MALIDDIKQARETVAEAERVRQDLRWKVPRDDPDRNGIIETVLEDIRKAMVPIRSAMGRAIWNQIPAGEERDLRAVSKALQYQRKQLKKMLTR